MKPSASYQETCDKPPRAHRMNLEYLWRWFTETPALLARNPEEQQRDLLEVFIWCIIAALSAVGVVSVFFRAPWSVPRETLFPLGIGAFAFFFTMMALNRATYHRTAAAGTVLGFAFLCFLDLALSQDIHFPWPLAYLAVPLIVASMFLSKRALLLLLAVLLVCVALLWVIVPGITIFRLPFIFLTSVTLLILVANRHQEIQESLRRDELARSEARYRDLIEHANDVVWRIAPDGCITFASPVAERLQGYGVEELIGMSFETLLAEESAAKAKRAFERRLAAGYECDAHRSLELVHRRKDGTEFIGETHSTPVYGPEGRLFEIQGITRDVTERRKAEEERRKLEEQLNQSRKMEAIGLLAGGIAHDFNNIVQIISGYSDIVEDTIPPGHPGRQEIREIGAASLRAAALVRQLLAFSRQEALERSVLDLNQLTAALVNMLRRIIGEHIAIELECGAHVPPVFADPTHIEQILVNLCINARDAMPNGGHIRIRTRERTVEETTAREHADRRPGSYATLSVADTGEGIPPEVLSRIFEPFFTTKPREKGTGLGLSTVYGMARQHGGWIECQSHLGQGTEFTLYLAATSLAKNAHARDENVSSRDCRGSETILIAEDDEPIRELTRRVLCANGYQVLAAKDGEEAIAMFDAHRQAIALAVLDLVMPGVNGYAVARHLREHSPALPILFSSGYEPSEVSAADKSIADISLLRKPYRASMMLQAVREILDGLPGQDRPAPAQHTREAAETL